MWSSSLSTLRIIHKSCNKSVYFFDPCCIFWPAFRCCILQMLVKLYFFNFFQAKKAEKRTKVWELRQNFAKHVFFFKLHQNTGHGFYSQIRLVLERQLNGQCQQCLYIDITRPQTFKKNKPGRSQSWMPVLSRDLEEDVPECSGREISQIFLAKIWFPGYGIWERRPLPLPPPLFAVCHLP